MNASIRVPLWMIAVIVSGSLAALAYKMRTHTPESQAAPLSAQSEHSEHSLSAPTTNSRADANPLATSQSSPLPGNANVTAPDRASTPPEAVPPEKVAQWIAAATGSDAKARADAIVALGGVPKSQALPVLKKVLSVGDPQGDRQLALSSLHVLALEQGDADGSIRSALRDTMYHGDDEALGESAQSILEDIESESCLGSTDQACNAAH